MRTLVLSDGGGAGVPDDTWFRGGEAYAEPQKKLLPDVKHQGKGNLLSALSSAWGGGSGEDGGGKDGKGGKGGKSGKAEKEAEGGGGGNGTASGSGTGKG